MNQDKLNKLFIISGPSGSGKTTLLNSIKDNDVELYRKYSTRQARRDYDDIKSVDIIPLYCDFQYQINNKQYGLSSRELIHLLKNRDTALILSDLSIIRQLKKTIPNTISVWIHCNDFYDHIKQRMIELESNDDLKARILLSEQRVDEYDKNRDEFDFTIVNNSTIDWMIQQFRALQDGISAQHSEIIIEEYSNDKISKISSDLIIANKELKSYFAKNPEKLFKLSPRSFEELIASILHDMGYDVQLTPKTHDGGFDIRALNKNGIAPFLTLVECKKYSPDRPVGIELVRNLHGVLNIENANAAALITTSYFTSGAIDLQRRLGFRLSLHDYNKLQEWLKRYL